MLLIMNKEVMRITVNSAYEFVYLYEKHIKTKNSFSTPLFYLQTDIDVSPARWKTDLWEGHLKYLVQIVLLPFSY